MGAKKATQLTLLPATVEKREPPQKRLTNSVREFCSRIGISRAMLYNLWNAGKGPPIIKLGKRTLIPKKGAEKWLKKLEINPTKRL